MFGVLEIMYQHIDLIIKKILPLRKVVNKVDIYPMLTIHLLSIIFVVTKKKIYIYVYVS